jgi:ABC-2 type transport system ATP-binding protein
VAIVELTDVSKVYRRALGARSVPALQGVTLRIEAGEVFALVGPNRSGKTTLLKMVLSLSWPSSGQVHRFGMPAACRSTLARVGYMHEDQAFPRYLSAAGLLEYYGSMTLVPKPALRHQIPQLLDMVGLADRQHEHISRFSKGMVQRLALAQALLNDPDLLVLDEPSEGLDQAGRKVLHEVIRRRKDRGKSTLLVSHLLGDVERLCDRVGVLSEGKLVALGPLASVTRDPATGAALPLDVAIVPLYEGLSV